jgi:Domain of unknown function (DUF4082)/Abnormal spindle-like microcephaly-assoc'd, ASPM-SPD-2-Hydin
MMRLNRTLRVCLCGLALVTLLSCGANLAAATETLFTTQAPQLVNETDGSSANYELGMKFTSAVAGHINAIRFWKSSRETGTHVGHIWNTSGQLLASITFVNETSSGWQQQALTSPLAVNANTIYVVTVNTGNTYYVSTDTGFASKVVNHDLSSVVGNNGVYGPTGRFPTNTWEASNYFRDVVFTPATTAGLTSNPASLNLGNVNVGSSSSQTLTITNNAAGSVTISKVATVGNEFSAAGMAVPFTLAAGKQVSLKLSFSATSMGAATGSLTLTSNASNPTLTVPLSATGMQPQITVVPAAVSFTGVALGTSNTQTLTVRDSGNANLIISQATIGGTGFGMTGPTLPTTVAPGQSTAFTVRFSPATSGSAVGTITITSNAPNSLVTVPLSGTSVSQSLLLSASPTSLAFGNVTEGTSKNEPVTLTNTGNSSVTVSKLTSAGNYFSVSSLATPVTLAPGQTASFSAAFAPTAAGSFSGTISVASTATNSPLSIPLSGSGIASTTHKALLSWTPSTSVISGYNVYRGTQRGGPYTKITSSLVPGVTYTDLNVQAGLTYYYVVTSVESNGMESAYSAEISGTIP